MIDFPETGGDFFRVLDQGRGVDSGRTFASYQADELRSHSHITRVNLDRSSGAMGNSVFGDEATYGTTGLGTQSTGGNETRPRNLAFPILVEV